MWGGLAKLPKQEVPSQLLEGREEHSNSDDAPEKTMHLERRLDPIFQADFVSGVFANLKRLDLSREATDRMLRNIAAEGLPELEVLVCVRSRRLTDRGVLALAGRRRDGGRWDIEEALKFLDRSRPVENGEPPCAKLREINLTFCERTTFEMTLALRQLLPRLRCIRRLPVFMTGHVQTPFPGEDGKPEVHTYWPDGSFRFTRSTESLGFIRELREDEPGVVRNSIQYANFASGPLGFHWPEWVDLCFRVGVSVSRADGLVEYEGWPDGVFVLQAYGGLRAPARFPPGEAARSVPPGGRVVMTRGGQITEGDPNNQHSGCLMLSHMRVRPLAPDDNMPPRAEVNRMVRFVLKSRRWPAFKQQLVESAIHWELCGEEDDDQTWRDPHGR